MFPLPPSCGPSVSGGRSPKEGIQGGGDQEPEWPSDLQFPGLIISHSKIFPGGQAVCDLILLPAKWDSRYLPSVHLTGMLYRAVN